MPNRYMKKHCLSLIIRKMQIKITVKFYLIQLKRTNVKNSKRYKISSAGEDVLVGKSVSKAIREN
jgi:hypothetical protein